MVNKVPAFEALENVNRFAKSSLKPTLTSTIRTSCAEATAQRLLYK
jgi:hypothetical protein